MVEVHRLGGRPAGSDTEPGYRGLPRRRPPCGGLLHSGVAAGVRRRRGIGAALVRLDCADGQLARLTGTFSDLGGWLDAMFDRLKEYAVYAGLAIGSARSGDDVWLLAVTALVLQTVRHALDSAWSVTPAAVSAQNEGGRRRAAGRRRRWHWSRKVAILPISERSMLISVLAAATSPRFVFAVLIGAGGLPPRTWSLPRRAARCAHRHLCVARALPNPGATG